MIRAVYKHFLEGIRSLALPPGPSRAVILQKALWENPHLAVFNPCLYPLLCGSHQHLRGRKSFFWLYSQCVSSFPLVRADFTLVNHASHSRASEAPKIASGFPMEHGSIDWSYGVSQRDVVPVPSVQNALPPCSTTSLSTASRCYLFPFLFWLTSTCGNLMEI